MILNMQCYASNQFYAWDLGTNLQGWLPKNVFIIIHFVPNLWLSLFYETQKMISGKMKLSVTILLHCILVYTMNVNMDWD